MSHVEVQTGSVKDGRIASLNVRFPGLPQRTIDRDTALAWMKDGHALLPKVDGALAPALRLVEIGEADDVHHVIRFDGAKEDADQLPW